MVGVPSNRFVYFFSLFSGLSGELLIHVVAHLDVNAIFVLMVCLPLDAHDGGGGVGRRVDVVEVIPAMVTLVVVGLAKGLGTYFG